MPHRPPRRRANCCRCDRLSEDRRGPRSVEQLPVGAHAVARKVGVIERVPAQQEPGAGLARLDDRVRDVRQDLARDRRVAALVHPLDPGAKLTGRAEGPAEVGARRLGKDVVLGHAVLAVEDELGRALHETIAGDEDVAPHEQGLVELRRIAAGAAEDELVGPLGAEAVEPYAAVADHEIEERLALEVRRERRAEAQEVGPP